MSQVKGKDTKPEMIVRKFLFAIGYRYKLHDKKLPGKPDIVLPKYKTVIFVHGCFWHGHEKCKYFVLPKTRTKWWYKKISRNKQLDNENIALLRRSRWKIITVFECKLKPKFRKNTLDRLNLRLCTTKMKIK
jgi:DNA mismatch endonuclease (patch repair protein)